MLQSWKTRNCFQLTLFSCLSLLLELCPAVLAWQPTKQDDDAVLFLTERSQNKCKGIHEYCISAVWNKTCIILPLCTVNTLSDPSRTLRTSVIPNCLSAVVKDTANSPRIPLQRRWLGPEPLDFATGAPGTVCKLESLCPGAWCFPWWWFVLPTENTGCAKAMTIIATKTFCWTSRSHNKHTWRLSGISQGKSGHFWSKLVQGSGGSFVKMILIDCWEQICCVKQLVQRWKRGME